MEKSKSAEELDTRAAATAAAVVGIGNSTQGGAVDDNKGAKKQESAVSIAAARTGLKIDTEEEQNSSKTESPKNPTAEREITKLSTNPLIELKDSNKTTNAGEGSTSTQTNSNQVVRVARNANALNSTTNKIPISKTPDLSAGGKPVLNGDSVNASKVCGSTIAAIKETAPREMSLVDPKPSETVVPNENGVGTKLSQSKIMQGASSSKSITQDAPTKPNVEPNNQPKGNALISSKTSQVEVEVTITRKITNEEQKSKSKTEEIISLKVPKAPSVNNIKKTVSVEKVSTDGKSSVQDKSVTANPKPETLPPANEREAVASNVKGASPKSAKILVSQAAHETVLAKPNSDMSSQNMPEKTTPIDSKADQVPTKSNLNQQSLASKQQINTGGKTGTTSKPPAAMKSTTETKSKTLTQEPISGSQNVEIHNGKSTEVSKAATEKGAAQISTSPAPTQTQIKTAGHKSLEKKAEQSSSVKESIANLGTSAEKYLLTKEKEIVERIGDKAAEKKANHANIGNGKNQKQISESKAANTLVNKTTNDRTYITREDSKMKNSAPLESNSSSESTPLTNQVQNAPAADGDATKVSAPPSSIGANSMDVDSDDGSGGEELLEVDGLVHPYVGKMARVDKGRFVGMQGRILRVRSRGWWIIDHPQLVQRKVHSRRCTLVETVEEEELRKYYAKIGQQMNENQPNKRKVDSLTNDSEEGTTETNLSSESLGGKEKLSNTLCASDPHNNTISSSKISTNPSPSTPISKDSPRKKMKVNKDESSLAGGNASILDNECMEPMDISSGMNGTDPVDFLNDSIKVTFEQEPEKRHPQLERRQARGDHVVTEPPIILDNIDLPSTLRHLPLNSKVDIFDRSTGRVMSGDEAVYVKDLPGVLRQHAAYEPIVPPPRITGQASASYREGRTSARVRVSPSVNPQISCHASSFEGRFVIVKKGPYRGLVGKIDACVPGGWYLIEGIMKEDDLELPLVISPKHVELLPDLDEKYKNDKGQTPGLQTPNTVKPVDREAFLKEFQGFLAQHFSGPIRSLKLHIDALAEEKKTLSARLIIQPVDEDGVSRENLSALDRHRIQVRLNQVKKELHRAENEIEGQLKASALARSRAHQVLKSQEELGER